MILTGLLHFKKLKFYTWHSFKKPLFLLIKKINLLTELFYCLHLKRLYVVIELTNVKDSILKTYKD